MAKTVINYINDNEYYTPYSLVQRFGDFDYDPATTKEKAEEFNIHNYDTIETNGLLTDWTQYNKIWCNPPFTIKHKFIEKAWQTYLVAKNNIYVLFPIEFITTKKFFNIGCTGTIYTPNGRIKFEPGLGKQSKSPPFGSVILKMGNHPLVIENIEI